MVASERRIEVIETFRFLHADRLSQAIQQLLFAHEEMGYHETTRSSRAWRELNESFSSERE